MAHGLQRELQALLPEHVLLSGLLDLQGLPSDKGEGASMEAWHVVHNWILGTGTLRDHDFRTERISWKLVHGGKLNDIFSYKARIFTKSHR